MNTSAESRREALRRVAGWYDRNGFQTRTNDGLYSSFPLDSRGTLLWPHMAVMEGQVLVRVVEVETGDSLGDQAVSRWRLSRLAGVPLHVYVPTASFERAFQMRTEADLMDVKLLPYDEEEPVSAWSASRRIHDRA